MGVLDDGQSGSPPPRTVSLLAACPTASSRPGGNETPVDADRPLTSAQIADAQAQLQPAASRSPASAAADPGWRGLGPCLMVRNSTERMVVKSPREPRSRQPAARRRPAPTPPGSDAGGPCGCGNAAVDGAFQRVGQGAALAPAPECPAVGVNRVPVAEIVVAVEGLLNRARNHLYGLDAWATSFGCFPATTKPS
jgi:hypothetical protein